jgi:hypothetical protein
MGYGQGWRYSRRRWEIVALIRAVGERRLRAVTMKQFKDLVEGLVGVELKGIVPPLHLLSNSVVPPLSLLSGYIDTLSHLSYPWFSVNPAIFCNLCHYHLDLSAEFVLIMLSSTVVIAVIAITVIGPNAVAVVEGPAVIIAAATEAEAGCHLYVGKA